MPTPYLLLSRVLHGSRMVIGVPTNGVPVKVQKAWLTGCAVVAIAVGAGASVAAGLQALGDHSQSDVGQLTMAGQDPTAQPIAVADNFRSSKFRVENAGIVKVSTDGNTVRLDGVEASPGWTVESQQQDPALIRVVLAGAARYEFTAAVANGAIDANVAALTAPTTSTTVDTATGTRGFDAPDERGALGSAPGNETVNDPSTNPAARPHVVAAEPEPAPDPTNTPSETSASVPHREDETEVHHEDHETAEPVEDHGGKEDDD